MRRDVVLVEAQPRRAHGERPKGLAGREPLESRDADFDHEAPARFQVRGDIAEALDLLVLGGQVHDRVEHEVGEPERLADPGGCEVANRDADIVGTGLRPQARDHRRGQVDPVHTNTPLAERQRDAAGADPQFEGTTFSCEIGEKAHGGLDNGGLEHVR